jgi:hypothetical protein
VFFQQSDGIICSINNAKLLFPGITVPFDVPGESIIHISMSALCNKIRNDDQMPPGKKLIVVCILVS